MAVSGLVATRRRDPSRRGRIRGVEGTVPAISRAFDAGRLTAERLMQRPRPPRWRGPRVGAIPKPVLSR